MIAQTIILIITGIAALVVQMIYFLIDDRSENHTARDRRIKKYWHWAGGAIHVWMAYAVVEIAHDWRWGLLMGALTWLLFDGFINTYVLRREWWYIGESAWLDKAQRTVAGAIHVDHRALSAFLKVSALIISILLLIPDIL
jgi:hypothetical protein